MEVSHGTKNTEAAIRIPEAQALSGAQGRTAHRPHDFHGSARCLGGPAREFPEVPAESCQMVKRRRRQPFRRGPADRRLKPNPRPKWYQPTQQQLDRRWLAQLESSWYSPVPPTGRKLMQLVARRNEGRVKAEQRQRRKETARRRRPVRADKAHGLVPTKIVRKAAKIPEKERGRRGLAPRGKASTLTPTVASTILEMRAAGHTIAAVAEELGHPPATISHWLRTGRAKAVAAVEN